MATQTLKNPGPEAPKNLTFDTYPDPREFLAYGGRPGVSYIYVLSESVTDAMERGWDSINGMPHFKVRGHSMTILGKGRPSLMTNPGSAKPIFFLEEKARKRIGIDLGLDGRPKPQEPQAKAPAPTARPTQAAPAAQPTRKP